MVSAQMQCPSGASLTTLRDDACRERLLDMEVRLRPYRFGCFAILALALTAVGAEIGWWWIVPLLAGLAGFAVAGRFMRSSEHPALWVAAAWGILPLLLLDAVVGTGGAASPVLMWFALPAGTLGVRFEPRGIALGAAYIVVLMLVGTVGLDAASAAAHRQELVAALALVLSTVILCGALNESDRAHRRRSTFDPLTGLLNRSALDRRLGELDSGSVGAEGGRSHALLLCDLDNFKRVNDRFGHAAGDAVLQEIAQTMRASLRAGDSIYRVGGEEILVVLPGATRDNAVGVAERLRHAVRERRPVGVQVTISVGVAVSSPGTDADELIQHADEALYSAKAGGRDRVMVSSN
ncbi:MAG TPA: GGDEF domain-containing protein [Solirubrobacterales bacterium]|nr:GGDEF domain-containing protein [Solirubrobacterales bacterium]